MISVVIPAFNEDARIRPTVLALHQVLQGQAFELVVVDDGSTDDTVAVVEGLGLPQVRVLRAPSNRGKGHALRIGMLAARGELRVFCDADGATSPDQLPALLAPLLAGQADVSIGTRYADHSQIVVPQPWWRRLWSRLANGVVQALLLPGIVDPHCGFKAFSGAAAQSIFERCRVDGWSCDLEILALARAHGLVIAEVPVRWADDARSRGRLSHLWTAAAELVVLKRRLGRHPQPGGLA